MSPLHASLIAATIAAFATSVASADTKLLYEIVVPDGVELGSGLVADARTAVSRRINPRLLMTGRARVRAVDEKRLEITIPGGNLQRVAQVERLLEYGGHLEFRVLANRHDHQALIARAQQQQDDQLTDQDGALLAWWVPVHALPDRRDDWNSREGIVTRNNHPAESERLEVLVVKDQYDLSGSNLQGASSKLDERGAVSIDLMFNVAGGAKLLKLTAGNLSDDKVTRYLGILLDGRLMTAPSIRGAISTRALITGRFSEQQAQDIVAVLSAGRLPCRLRKVEQAGSR